MIQFIDAVDVLLSIALVQQPILITLFHNFLGVNVLGYKGVPLLYVLGPLLESLLVEIHLHALLDNSLGINLTQMSSIKTHSTFSYPFIFLPLLNFLENKLLLRFG